MYTLKRSLSKNHSFKCIGLYLLWLIDSNFILPAATEGHNYHVWSHSGSWALSDRAAKNSVVRQGCQKRANQSRTGEERKRKNEVEEAVNAHSREEIKLTTSAMGCLAPPFLPHSWLLFLQNSPILPLVSLLFLPSSFLPMSHLPGFHSPTKTTVAVIVYHTLSLQFVAHYHHEENGCVCVWGGGFSHCFMQYDDEL